MFNFDGLQKHTLALRSRTAGRRNPTAGAGETEPAEAACESRPPADTR